MKYILSDLLNMRKGRIVNITVLLQFGIALQVR